MITGIHHVQLTIPEGAEAAARAFYRDLLGLAEIPKSSTGRGGFWLDLAGVQIHIGVQNGIDRAALKTHVCFECRDLSVWRRRLESHGVALEAADPIPGFERFMARDPFGNRLEFLELSWG